MHEESGIFVPRPDKCDPMNSSNWLIGYQRQAVERKGDVRRYRKQTSLPDHWKLYLFTAQLKKEQYWNVKQQSENVQL